MKRYVFLILLLMLASCAHSVREADFRCPKVSIPAEKSYVTQIVNYADNFRIELIGYEGYCYIKEGTARRYAVITPQFKLTRLRDNDESLVDFRYYTEVLQGPPEYLGKQSYFATGKIALDAKEVQFSGRPVQVKIPLDNDELEIFLGLDISEAELDFNRSTFAPYVGARSKQIQTPCGFIETEEENAAVPAQAASGCSRCSVRR